MCVNRNIHLQKERGKKKKDLSLKNIVVAIMRGNAVRNLNVTHLQCMRVNTL